MTEQHGERRVCLKECFNRGNAEAWMAAMAARMEKMSASIVKLEAKNKGVEDADRRGRGNVPQHCSEAKVQRLHLRQGRSITPVFFNLAERE